MRLALFNYNTGGSPGGPADFNSFTVDEPRPRGLTKPIPVSQSIALTDLATGNVLAVVNGTVQSVNDAGKATAFKIVDRGKGRVSIQTADGKYVSVSGDGQSSEVTVKAGRPGDAETFQWVDLQRGETLLLSLATNRYLVAPKNSGAVAANHAGPAPDRRDGSCFTWQKADRK